MTAAEEWKQRIASIKVGRSRGQPALHKPLLTLLLLARAKRGKPRVVPYLEVREPLRGIIDRFGPGKGADPKLPFWHLQGDGFWHVLEADALEMAADGRRPKQSAMSSGVGEVPERLWRALLDDPALIDLLATMVLDKFWSTEKHKEVKAAVGL